MTNFLKFLQSIFCVRKQTSNLHLRMYAVHDFRGWSKEQVSAAAGQPPCAVKHRPDGCIEHTWKDRNYSITLLFEKDGRCLGVAEEQMNYRNQRS